MHLWLTLSFFLSLVSFFLCLPGALCRNLWAGRGGREQEVSGEFQEVAIGGDDPGDRGRSGLTHRPETPVKGDTRWRPSSHSSPTCIRHPPQPAHHRRRKMKVLFVSSELLMMFTLFFSPPSHIPQWTHVLLNFRVKDREGEESLVFICSPSSTLIKEICGYTGTDMLFFYSIKEPIVPSLTGSCIIFLSSCLCVLVLTNFGSPFSFSEETETDSSLHNLTQTCLTHRVSVL